MRVSVIVCTHTLERTRRALEAVASVERQTVPPDELIVVVDHNDDVVDQLRPVVEAIERFPARLVHNAYDPGLSGARNTGVDEAAGDVLAFLDDDAVASEDWLETLLTGYDDAGVWGVGGRVVPMWLADRPPWLPDEFYWVIGCTYRGMPTETTRVRNLHGCNASFRRELFSEIGRFSPALGRRGTFLAGAEETELCLRAAAIRPDRHFVFSPHAVVSHAVPSERTRAAYFISRCFCEGRSKAWMVRSTGVARGLSAEFAYLRRLPALASRLALEGGTSRRDALSRAAAAIVGSAVTVAGFAYELPGLARRPVATDETVEPVDDSRAGEEEPSVSVIVCTYSTERWSLLGRAIASLEEQTLPPLEIIVVVDHRPELASRARTTFRNVRVIDNAGPTGLSGARNTGIAASRGEIVAFLDDDAVADREWLERICSAFADQRVAGVGGYTSAEWHGARPAWWPSEFDWIVGASYRGMPRQRRFVRNVHGGNAAFRRTLFDEVGGFLPNVGRVGSLPYGGEETELCIRARRLIPGARFVHEPTARIQHHVPAERTGLPYFVSRCFREGMSKAMIVRHEGARSGLRTESHYVGRVLPRAALQAFSGLVRGDRASLTQAGASVLGVSVATAGFIVRATREATVARRHSGAPRIQGVDGGDGSSAS